MMKETRPPTLNRTLAGVPAVFGTVMLVGGTDMTKVTVALPALNEALSLGVVQSLWVADIYALAAGVVLVASAVLADRYGRKRTYLLGLSVAIVSAIVAGLAPSAAVLIAARIGQGIGSALLIAGTVAIIRVTFPGVRLRALAYGVWTAGFSTGSALGPLLGGGLVDLMQWQWVFWINVPILLACLIAAWKVLPESRNPDPPKLDALSAGLSAAAVGLLIAGLKGLTPRAVPEWVALVAVGVGIVALVLFVIRQHLPRPFLDVRLFTNHLLAVSAAVIAVTLGVFNGTLYLLTLRHQVIDGLSAIDAGIALIPLAAAMAAGGLCGPLLQRWLALQHVIVAGLVLVAIGSLVLATTPGAGQLVGMITLGLGSGIVMAIGANAVMSAASTSRTADAGAIQECSFALGAGAGIAVLGVLAIHFGAPTTGSPSAEAIYGPGTETALGLTAFFYTFFALAAGLIILSTTKSRNQAEQHR